MTTLTAFMLMVPLGTGFGGAKPNCAPCAESRPTAPQPYRPDINANRPCPPIGPPAQVLAAKVVAPDGVRITAFPGTPTAKTFANTALFGLRPGYIYRFELGNIGGNAESVLYPEVEVRGSLVLRPGMGLMEHFAGIHFSNRDLERAITGAMITKVIYLEDPTVAVPIQTEADKPHEIAEDSEDAALKIAAQNGRIVAIVRLGNRKPSAEELSRVAIANTILLPGEMYLATAACPAPLAWCGVTLFDPILGPKFPAEECFIDGGDTGPRLGVRDDGRLGGLTPTDTAAEFTVGSKKKVTTSNTVCICVPRFVVRRVEQGAIGVQVAQRPEADTQHSPPAILKWTVRPKALIAREKPYGLLAMIHSQIVRGGQQSIIITSTIGPRAIYNVESIRMVKAFVEPLEVQNADEFLLTKEVDPKEHVTIGKEVTITLRYFNRTGKPVDDLVVSDSLSGRLEYVPGTAQSDRATNVTTSANEAGSVVVRFELPGTLQPGQGGVVTFKAKVR